MRYGHVKAKNKYAITGNRYNTIISIYECENPTEVTHFIEKYDFEPSDIMSLMHNLGVNYTVLYDDMETYDGISRHCIIESDGLVFQFIDNQIQAVYKKYNVYDELMERFNLKPLS